MKILNTLNYLSLTSTTKQNHFNPSNLLLLKN